MLTLFETGLHSCLQSFVVGPYRGGEGRVCVGPRSLLLESKRTIIGHKISTKKNVEAKNK